jgi:DnaJ-class molecular chaperone
MAKVEKIMTKCPSCDGKGVIPWEIARELPKPSRNIPCTRCNGKKFIFAKPKKK